METLSQLKNKRTVLKSNLSKFKTAFEEIQVQTDVNDKAIYSFQAKVKRAEGYLQEFLDVQIKIEESQGNEDQEIQIDDKERDWFEKTYYDHIPGADMFVKQYNKSNAPGSSTTVQNCHNSRSVMHEIPVKLPSINLPRFNGSYENWMAFRDRFTALIDNNATISDVQKIIYLKSCLCGAAEKLIDPLDSTAVNYPVAWAILKESYDNKRIIIYKHVEAIYAIESFNKESSVAIRNLLETVGHHIKCLNTWKQPTDSWDTLLICALRSKVDNLTRREWENSCSTELPTLVDFLAFLRKKCDTLENTSRQLHFSISENVPKRAYHVVNTTKQDVKSKNPKCSVCSGNHQIYKCDKFIALSPEERHKRVTQLKLCFKCLRDSHSVAQCRLNNCRLCNRSHNILLHRAGGTEHQGPSDSHQSAGEQLSSSTPTSGNTTGSTSGSTINGVVNHSDEVLHNCVTCFKCQPVAQTTEVGQLPEARVAQAPPFYNSGVDFAGPFFIRDKRSRGSKLIKTYVCLFVCFAVKAVHLELVSDLSTEAFLAAIRRFIARRGKPKCIHSDNATNFRGAHNEMRRMVVTNSDTISNILVDDGIDWRFIPPRSPHFGGIWEAGIKSVKKHLLRVIGSANLLFEEFYTVLTQIEAVLNSRPLCPLSNDPNDLCALTPAHFLIGRTLTGAPDMDIQEVQINRLSRFQRVQQLQQHFWSRWSREYVSQLQQRPRHRAPSAAGALTEGALVIVREDNLPPLLWQLGRITDLHPGADGVVRVVTMRTQKGIIKREVRKICLLPTGQD